MKNVVRHILSAMLLIAPISSHAVLLQNGDVLNFSTSSGSYVSGLAAGGQAFDSATLDALNGLVIGTSQPTVPDIDQTWTSTSFGVIGNHRTSSAVAVIDEFSLDFGGWTMVINGEDYAFGASQGTASYSFDGSSFTLDYSWDAALHNGGLGLGSLNVTLYNLHLEGTVSSVPVPAAVWLFGSGLLGLSGLSIRRRS